jgi:hypothetical protein
MTPILALKNVCNGGTTDAILLGQGAIRSTTSCVVSANSENVSFVKLCSAVSHTFGLSVFYDFVAHIIGMGAKKKMVRSDAASVVTVMKDIQSADDCAVRQLPRKAMCLAADMPAFVALDKESSVAPTGYFAGPQPAAVSLLDVGPETLDEWYTRFSHGRPPTAVKVRDGGSARYTAAVPFITQESDDG